MNTSGALPPASPDTVGLGGPCALDPASSVSPAGSRVSQPKTKPNRRNLPSPRILLSSTRLRTPIRVLEGPEQSGVRCTAWREGGMGVAGRVAWDLARGGDMDVGSDGAITEHLNTSGVGERRGRPWAATGCHCPEPT